MPLDLDHAHNLLLCAELRRVTECFSRVGLRHYVIKGVPLTLELHGRLDGRAFVDNDVVVHDADCDEAYAQLLTLGYLDEDRSYAAARTCQYQHAVQREHPTGAFVRLELHWSPFSPVLFKNGKRFWDELTQFNNLNVNSWTLNPKATVVHLATHWLSHGINQGSILKDLGQAWDHFSAELDPAQVFHLAEEIGASIVLGAALAAATDAGLCHSPWPQEWLSRRARVLVRAFGARRLARATDVNYGRTAASWLLLEDTAALQRVLRWELLPSEARLRYIYGAEASSFEFKRAYALRPLQALSRGLRPRAK